MTNLEEALHRTLTDDRHAMPGWTDPAQRIVAGIRRRRRRRVTVVAAAAAVLAMVAGAAVAVPYYGLRQPAAPPTGVQPWVADPTTAPQLQRRSPREARAQCQGPRLADAIWTEVHGYRTTVFLANMSIERCTLSQDPTLTAAGADVPTGRESLNDRLKQVPATIDPGEPARIDIVATRDCPDPRPWKDLALRIHDRSYPIPGIGQACGFTLSPWYVQPPLINANITVTMRAPGQVRRGETLDYTVTLINTLSKGGAGKLQPCPSYRQTLGTVSEVHRLNCTGGRIPLHSSRTFAMRLVVAPDAPIGPVMLHWMLMYADGTVGIAEIANDGVPLEVIP